MKNAELSTAHMERSLLSDTQRGEIKTPETASDEYKGTRNPKKNPVKDYKPATVKKFQQMEAMQCMKY